MKTEEDEAFDELAKRQGAWGSGFPAKRKAAADKLQETNITRPCRSCNGTGDRDTGIPESPIATCKPCNGTGQIALAQPAQEQPVHMEMPEPEGWYCYDHDYPYEGHKYHTVEQIQKIVTAAVEADRKALAQPTQEPINLLEARKIAAEYGTPDSQIDSGNLYFALSKCLEHIDAQPAQEPVGTLNISRYKGHLVNHDFDYFGELPDGTYSVYTAPPQRPWVGLTDKDRKAALLTAYKEWECEEFLLCAREDYLLIEQALKEKNNGT